MNGDKLLEIKNLTVHYESFDATVHAVENLNLSLRHGETLGLVGETGAGKTTTVKSVMRILPDPPAKIVSGEILFDGQDLLKLSVKEMRKIRGKQISMIFQDPMTSLNPVMTVAEQIAEVIRLHEKCSEKDACNPRFLIADEPTTALDVTIQAQVLELMKRLKAQYQTAMIMITHDLGIVADICDYVAIMYAGEVVEYGTREHIFNHTGHPYTRGLFACIPDIFTDQNELEPINGLTPDPTQLPEGCRFHPRCPHATERCAKEHPENIELAPGHFVACHLANKGGNENA